MENINKNHILFIFIISFLFVLPILISNTYYLDDMGRTLYGYDGFKENGRYLSSLIISIFSFGFPLSNPGPLSQVFASFLVFLGAYILTLRFDRSMEGWKRVLMSTSFILNPCFLEVLSFNFDSITISSSVLLLCLAVYYYDLSLKGSCCFVFFTLMCLMSYQASISLLIGIVMLTYVFDLNRSFKYSLINLSTKAFLVILSYLLYKIIYIYISSGNSEVEYRGETIFFAGEFIEALSFSIKENLAVGLSIIHGKDRHIYYLFIFLFIISPLYIIERKEIKTYIAKMTLSYFMLIGIFLSTFIIQSLLKHSVVAARVFVSYSSVTFICLLVVTRLRWKAARNFFLIIFILHSFIMASIYSRLLESHDRHYENIAQSLKIDIGKISVNHGDNEKFLIRGKPPVSLDFAIAEKKIPFFRYLIQEYIDNNYLWGYMVLKIKGVYINNPGPEEMKVDGCKETGIESEWYNICKKDDVYIINFKEK
ncbi:glucosyltransferase domain-containing protein [Pantoea stewartii]|uniref:glucosyltransferase domain-containing protein n=1 Tax=Pantoea stewartii TaxID=66269 RepID=UPI002DBFA11D|nr:glucosyltransferase domain-containing protein [Pantoea stewartii]MEB6533284.1 glucosyltransferase domain-containing protein [Pantoea stewartii]